MAQPSTPTGALCARHEQTVKQLILANLAQTPEVTDLARACELSRSHFSRAFKRSTGMSPRDWIRQQRIKRAKVLIAGSALNLTQISQECGYCDQAHFSNLFSRSEGVNPMTWRKHQQSYRVHLRAIQLAIVNSEETVIQNPAS